MSKHHYSYLALGDSYTIGESLPLYESFPYQAVQLLRKAGYAFQAPEIVAQTGWTSFELAEHLLHRQLSEAYDFVTLLIGVNNQYRGLPADDFANDFAFLLRKAIHLAGNRPDHVTVLSIPDWGNTLFAAGKDRATITGEIDHFNNICESKSRELKTSFISITEDTRKAAKDHSLLAGDKLHYSGKEYAIWAGKLVEKFIPYLHK